MSRRAPRDGPLGPAEAEALLGSLLRSAVAPVVLAVSGGPDSVCLMREAARLRNAGPLHVATIDHGLRPGSAEEAGQVARWAGEIGLPHRILTWDGPKPGAGLQEAARAERYRLLAGFARGIGASHLLTAHTLDDQAETIVLRFLKGSGLAGLKGMGAARTIDGVVLARPFLDIRKSRLVATCEAQDWPFLRDPSNRDPLFARARLRRWLPDLEREGFTPERFAALARRLARADSALDAEAEAAFARLALAGPGRVELDAAGVARLPEEIAIRVLGQALARAVPQARPFRLAALERLALALRAGGAGGTLAGAEIRRQADGKLLVRPEPPRRGRSLREAAITADDAAPPHSLGKGKGHA